MAQQVHRASSLKQHNKKHNKLGHKTKGQVKAQSQGRQSVIAFSRKAKHELSRVERRNQVKVVRADKKEKNLLKKRKLGTESQPPFLVCVLPLSVEVDSRRVLAALKAADPQATTTVSGENTTHISCARFKQRFAFVEPRCDDLYAVLDTTKVCTTLLVVWPCCSEETGLNEEQQRLLSAIKAQGLPTPVHVTLGYQDMAQKKKSIKSPDCLSAALKQTLSLSSNSDSHAHELQRQFGDAALEASCTKRASRSLQQLLHEVRHYFPEDDKAKVHQLDKPGDALLCLRQIGAQKQRSLYYRNHRPHLLAEGLHFQAQEGSGSTGTLTVTGFLRGAALSPNDLVHLPGWGDYQLSKLVVHPADPHSLLLDKHKTDRLHEQEKNKKEDHVCYPDDQQCSLATTKDDTSDSSSDDSGQESDDDANSIDDDDDESLATKSIKSLTAVPVKKDKIPGTYCAKSSYQAAWMIDNEAFKEDFGGISSGEDSEAEEDEFLAPEARADDEESLLAVDDDDGMSVVSSSDCGDDAYDDKMDYLREMDEYQRIVDTRDDLEFPDEVETPRDVPARERFIKYRGLESFRNSPWDLNENLPEEYSKIFHIPRFDHYRKRIVAGAAFRLNTVDEGHYVTLQVKDVPTHLYEEHKSSGSPLVVFGLLLHEAKMSLVNVVLKSHSVGHTRPIKSKDRLIFHVGFRRYVNQPIFSEHTSGNKQKFCRYFHPGMTVVASMYAPVTYPPVSVLAFRQLSGNRQELVATGSVYTVNADRCILKRIVLSGHPFKIHKRSVVVRYMFFDRDDINWFKPIELKTKWGRRGDIKEALGTHGHMKCIFNGTLKSQDTILLQLYKRVFPKWTYNPCVPRCALLYARETLETSSHQDYSKEEEIDTGLSKDYVNLLRDKYLMPPPAKKPRKVHFN